MQLSAFMTPAEKVYTCTANNTIETVLQLFTTRNISAVVILGEYQDPVGLVTKSDLVRAYQQQVPTTETIGSTLLTCTNRIPLDTVLTTDTRDTAANLMEKRNCHHAIVVDQAGHFAGLVSSWDIAAEVARDARAWPWIRTEDGKIHYSHAH